MSQAARVSRQAGFKSREELETMISEMDRKLDVLYQNANALSRPIIWANLTNAILKLLAPEDQEYAYERLYALFKSHQDPQVPVASVAPSPASK
jgi:hypothetical protein